MTIARSLLRGAIEDLSFFAEKLPPDQFEQVFTEKRLEPLIKALMRRELPDDESDVAKNSIQFRIGCMLLKWSLNITESLLKREKESYR